MSKDERMPWPDDYFKVQPLHMTTSLGDTDACSPFKRLRYKVHSKPNADELVGDTEGSH